MESFESLSSFAQGFACAFIALGAFAALNPDRYVKMLDRAAFRCMFALTRPDVRARLQAAVAERRPARGDATVRVVAAVIAAVGLATFVLPAAAPALIALQLVAFASLVTLLELRAPEDRTVHAASLAPRSVFDAAPAYAVVPLLLLLAAALVAVLFDAHLPLRGQLAAAAGSGLVILALGTAVAGRRANLGGGSAFEAYADERLRTTRGAVLVFLAPLPLGIDVLMLARHSAGSFAPLGVLAAAVVAAAFVPWLRVALSAPPRALLDTDACAHSG